jgi:hypothetical protein
MEEKKQIECFEGDLDRLLTKYSDEFDMSLASQIGTLMCKIYELISSSYDDDEGGEEIEVEVEV